MFPTPNKVYGYERRWYQESADIEFEQYIFKGIKEYDEYLSFKFGEYMTLPPMEGRKCHPIVALELTTPKLEKVQK